MHVETTHSVEATTPLTQLPTLLIVGDPAGLNVAREALVELELGWEVVFAATGADADAISAVRGIDVILVDLGNPHIEGVDLVESLRSKLPHTPIVLMSAPYAVSVALEAIRKGANNHFPRDLLDSEPAAILETLRAAATENRRRADFASRLDHMAFEFTLDNDRASIPAVVGRLVEAAIDIGLCDRLSAMRVGVAIEECLLNAVIHGNLEVSSELRQVDESHYDRQIEERRRRAPFAQRRVRLTARISRHEGTFVVHDEGRGFDVKKIPDPTDPENLFRVGGRGILLMRSFMTAVQFSDRGNRVTLTKRRS
ncbi:MAG TPA: ATP-binding protein [Gemmataceae bacterium]|jgi:CheY-like chemotaxis protein/anti-sigma regulatory factor (Ser/Thr protein kinase)|nr:ATP-binding protein [Gemmataceae bacterium]